jgi:hypothetical protein
MRKTLTSSAVLLTRLVRCLVGNPMTLIAIVAITIGSAQLDFTASQPANTPEFDDPPGSGVIVRTEVVYACVPQILIDLAERDLAADVASTHEVWKTALERHGHENVCYGLLVRAHQVNGRVVDLTFIRYPHRESESFQELQEVVAVAAGHPPVGHPARDYSRTTVQIAPRNASRREILESIKALSRSEAD